MTAETIMLIAGILGWLALLLTMWGLTRRRDRRIRKQEQAHLDRMMKGWDR